MTALEGAGLDVLAQLAPWREAGVLAAADVHIAATLARLGGLGPIDADVALAVALAARAPRLGHTCLDLATVAESVPAEVERDADAEAASAIEALPWPADVAAWRAAVAASPLTVRAESVGDGSLAGAPLVLDGDLVYLERYRAYEDAVADELVRRAAEPPVASSLDPARRAELLEALLGPEAAAPGQWTAASSGATRSLAVIVGGPGTGKTRTVAALLALLIDGDAHLRIALAAPTGKAAARMGETFRETARELRASALPGAEPLAARLEAAEAATIHRLLGARPGRTRVRRDPRDPLVHDVVIVDETSMVSLPLMAKLLDGVRRDARLVLVGDPGQLASVEAGSVLGDIAGAAGTSVPPSSAGVAGSLHVLTESYRFPSASPVGVFAAAVRAGDVDAAVDVLAGGAAPTDGAGGVGLKWVRAAGDTTLAADAVRAAALDAARRTAAAAREGDGLAALGALGEVRVLCAHRRGPFGISHWNRQVEQWLAGDGPVPRGFSVGRPLLVTANDRVLELFNGDLGVVVASPGGDGAVVVAFPHGQGVRTIGPARLESVETCHAMTIHKSQGSEFDRVVVVLPPPDSRLATRELLYTAITRARHGVTIIGSEASLRAAVERRVVRASGLGARLRAAAGDDHGPVT